MGIQKPERYICVGCGHDVRGRQVFDVGSLSPMLKGCVTCIGKYGLEMLRREADRMLALFEAKEAEKLVPKHLKGKCWHCADPVLRDIATGLYPMWCRACEATRQRIAQAGEIQGTLTA